MCAGFSKTQKCVTLSTSETEYLALGDAVKELIVLKAKGCHVFRF